MQCPFCKFDNSRVLESRSPEDARSIRRRRECMHCLHRFTTYERVELAPMVVIKKSNSREIYDRDKLHASILRSCSKAKISNSMISDIVDRVENIMYQKFPKEIPSCSLGEMVMDELKIIDPMAYLRYASIFKKINSITEFIEEMKNLDEDKLNQELLLKSF